MATTKIVTEVTLEQLDALVASNSLNEGLQYRVTDKNWLLVATSNNTYNIASLKYQTYACFLSENNTSSPDILIVQNEIGNIIWTSDLETKFIKATLNGAFPEGKTSIIISPVCDGGTSFGAIFTTASFDTDNGDYIMIYEFDPSDGAVIGDLNKAFIEIRVYII